MAKKKGKPQPRKSKKKRASSFMSSVKKMLLGAFAVVVCFIGVLFIYNWFYPVSKTRPVEKKQDRAETIVRPKISDKGGSGTSGKKAAQATKNMVSWHTTLPAKSSVLYLWRPWVAERGCSGREQALSVSHRTGGFWRATR